MIHLQIKELIAAKSAQWGRRITLLEVANATGISRMTLNRMMRQQGYNTVTDHLDKLCTYFQCDLNELVRYTPTLNDASNSQNLSRLAA
jgi:putative transcriptional regulator